MKTKILKPTISNVNFCVNLLKQGQIVAVPTETVYGLAANAFNDEAVLKIFKAKNRPFDNPLICHVSSFQMFWQLTSDNNQILNNLINRFWPGPFTVVVKNNACLSKYVVAGLDTVAVRFSSCDILNKVIDGCGFALAAPSANLSKKPSATNAQHVLHDFNGKLEAILDGGQCSIGLESTVVKIEKNKCVLLRPGFITVEMLKKVVENVELCSGVKKELKSNELVQSPGLKHRHYSPKAEVFVVKSNFENFFEYVKNKLNSKVYCVVFDDEQKYFSKFVLTYGQTAEQQAKNLFFVLRQIDDLNLNKVFFRCPEESNVGLAVFNRLIRAANFQIINL